MKKQIVLFLAMLALCFGLSFKFAFADEWTLNFVKFTVNCPVQNTSAVTMYDWRNGIGLIGAETLLASYSAISLNGGVVTGQIGTGLPFLSLNIKGGTVTPALPLFALPIGLWAGYDFQGKYLTYGVKVSAPFQLW